MMMIINLFFSIFSRSYFLFLVIWLRRLQFQPKIGRQKNKNIHPGPENKHSLKKAVCANFRSILWICFRLQKSVSMS